MVFIYGELEIGGKKFFFDIKGGRRGFFELKKGGVNFSLENKMSG